jgi:hypothetical protein
MFVIKGIISFLKGIKAWLLISEWLQRIENRLSGIEQHGEIQDANLELMRGHLDTLTHRITNIDEYGSKGTKECIDKVEKKMDTLDFKLDNTQKDVAKIQGYLKINGFEKRL